MEMIIMAKVMLKETKNKDVKEKNYITLTSIRKLMKNEGAKLISKDAVILLVKNLEGFAIKITKDATEVMKSDKRKRLSAEDVKKVCINE